MARLKTKEHTLKPLTKSRFLHPLQKRIFLCLANTHPQTINETKDAIKGHYKSTWTAFKSLEAKGLVLEIDTKDYRGNQYPRFWLTIDGVFFALIEGVSPKALLAKTLEIYPENKILQCMVEASTILGTDMYEIGYFAVLNKRKLDKSDVSAMFTTQLQKDISLKQLKELIAIMKRYPEQFGNLEEQVAQMRENLSKVESFLESARNES